LSEPSKNERFEPNAVFWGTWGGRVARAIVLHDTYTKEAIQKTTNLKDEEFFQAIKALSDDNLLEEKGNGAFWVTKELYGKCKSYYEILQQNLTSWVEEWRKKEGLYSGFGINLTHFYLSGRLLPQFSERLITKAREEILIASPYVKRCDICDSLKVMSKKGVDIKLLTREIQFAQFKKELTKSISISYDESIHSKLIVVDRRVAIVSSMNFYAGSTAGQCWEAGIVSLERDVVRPIYQSIIEKISNQNPE
jgi:hypothetical protein